MLWILRSPLNIRRSKTCAVIALAMLFAGVPASQAVVPPDPNAYRWRESPFIIDIGDDMRIESSYPFSSELSPREEFMRRLLVRVEQPIVAESKPQSARRPVIDHRDTFGATWNTTAGRRMQPRAEESLARIRMNLEVLGPMMTNGRNHLRSDSTAWSDRAIRGFPPSAAEFAAFRMLRELRLLRGELAARLANASSTDLWPTEEADNSYQDVEDLELPTHVDESWTPESCLAKIPLYGPGVVLGNLGSDVASIELPTSPAAETTMAELEPFPIWIYDDSRFWRERRRLTWTEIGRPLKLSAFVGLFQRSADAAESSSALYRTTSGQEFIEAWETLRASEGIVMSLRSPLADFWDYFERERFLSTLSVHFYQGPYAPRRYVAYYLIPPPEDISERIRNALFSIKLRRPDQPGEAVRETPIALLTIRRKPKVPIWVAHVVRQDLDDATIEEMKKPFDVWSRPFGEVHGSTGTYR